MEPSNGHSGITNSEGETSELMRRGSNGWWAKGKWSSDIFLFGFIMTGIYF